jgi:polysaccharide biosynthesis/export protein
MMKENLHFFQRIIPTIGIISFLVVCFTSSCKVTKQSSYFKTLQQRDTTLQGFVSNDFESKIIVGDRLNLTVTSLSPAEDALFNSIQIGEKAVTGATGSILSGYIVQADGTIALHRIGNIKAVGYTRKELARQIEKALLPYMKEPLAQINYNNHKITILGEVGKPQVINMPEEQISIIDALVLSGDISLNGKRDKVTIIRENGNEKQVKHVNLEDHSIFSSPWYYVKPNDIILVARDDDKFAKKEKREKLQGTLTLVASAVSLVIIILSQVFK